MSLYDQPVRVLLRNMIDEFKGAGRANFDTRDAIRWFAERYPAVKEGTIRAHLRRFSANDPTRLHYNPKPGEGLLFKLGPSNYRMYDPQSDPPEVLSADQGELEHAEEVEEETEDAGFIGAPEFAYERDLKNYLAKNLGIIEPGLRLYEDEDGEINGIEFDVGGRRIDILAVDARNNLIVIELKVSRAYDRVVGQLLRYMAWIEQHQARDEQSVRGIIVAREINSDLLLATSRVPGVDLFEYELSITLTRRTRP